MPPLRPATRRRAGLAALALSVACARTAGQPPPLPPPIEQPDPPADPQARPPPVWGVTVDDPWNLAPTVDALSRLPVRATARVVFDEGQRAADYAPLVAELHRVSDVLGELLDSFYVPTLSPAEYVARAEEYLDALGDDVDLWEVGNEVNGEWLGATADVVAKVRGAHEAVRSRGKRSALTLYYNDGCWASADHEMFAWTEANLPEDLRRGIDLLLVSYYAEDCDGPPPDWAQVFARLAPLFPEARLGLGESGTRDAARKEEVLRATYALRLPAEPRFVGGYFWWYFSDDMVPASRPLWDVLAEVVADPW